jgi:hypothetical protein
LISLEKEDRPDGYSWTAHVRFTYSNDVVGNWRMAGDLVHRGQRTEYEMHFTVDNVPPTTTPDRLVTGVRVSIDYGDGEDAANLRPARSRTVLLDQVTTFADGHADSVVRQPLLLQKPVRDLSLDETMAQVSRIVEKAG